MVRPNGIAFSPDEKLLDVADTARPTRENGPRAYRRFAVSADGRKVKGGGIFAEVSPAAGLFDGFRVDRDGRMWAAAAGVHCFDPDGTLIGKILIPEIVANVTFGGASAIACSSAARPRSIPSCSMTNGSKLGLTAANQVV